MSYPTDKDILERLPATCPELAAIFFPRIHFRVQEDERDTSYRKKGEINGKI